MAYPKRHQSPTQSPLIHCQATSSAAPISMAGAPAQSRISSQPAGVSRGLRRTWPRTPRAAGRPEDVGFIGSGLYGGTGGRQWVTGSGMSESRMQIEWNAVARADWDAAHASLCGALQQTWAYGDSLVTPQVAVHRAAVRVDGRRVALAQFLCRRYAGLLGVALCTRGPLWLERLPEAEQARTYRALRHSLPLRRPRFALFSPELTDARDPSLSTLTRVLTGYSTVMLDLSRPEAGLRAALHPYWRNRLAAAERSALAVAEVAPRPDAYRWVLQEEMRQRERKRFYALPTAFIDNYIAAHEDGRQAALILKAELQSRPVAAMLFLIHGSAATYQLGWSTPQGRACNAHNLVLWRAVGMLRERGVRKLDLGGVNTEDLPGISRFKINTGGEVVTYAGGFI